MIQPPGFEATDKALLCKLNKAIYGLKQAPRAWFDRLKNTLIQLGFHSRKCDPSFFIYSKNNSLIYMLLYVDDIIVTGSNTALVQQLVKQLNDAFSLKVLSATPFLKKDITP